MKIKLGVMFGGETVEHEVSIISALQAIQNLNKDKYDVIPIYIAKDRVMYTGDNLLEVESFKNFETAKKIAKEVNTIISKYVTMQEKSVETLKKYL